MMTEQQMPQNSSEMGTVTVETKQWHAPVIRCFEESSAEFGGDNGSDVTLNS